MQTSYLEVSNMITMRTISRGLHHEGIPASIKIDKAKHKLELMAKPIRS